MAVDAAKFGRWFAAQRAASGFASQQALADATGVSKSTILDIERGGGFVKRWATSKERLANALGWSVHEIEDFELGEAPLPDAAAGRRSNGESPVVKLTVAPALRHADELEQLVDQIRDGDTDLLRIAVRLDIISRSLKAQARTADPLPLRNAAKKAATPIPPKHRKPGDD